MNNSKDRFDLPIPTRPFPACTARYEPVEEPLVALKETDRLIYEPVYLKLGFEHATAECKLREGAAKRLASALDLLPCQYGFKIFDAWRPFKLQEALYQSYHDAVKAGNPGISEEEAAILTRRYVSPPSKDPLAPPVHTTGGAVDMTLFDLSSGKDLDMGSEFDCFDEIANTSYFEEALSKNLAAVIALSPEQFLRILGNRRLLYNVMTSAGFSNLPSEWWHYDYGTPYWAAATGNAAVYRAVL